MKGIILSVILIFTCGKVFAGTEVTELAQSAAVTYVSISTYTYVDISSYTLTSGMFAYNICSEAAIGGENIRCGYDIKVSTIAANNYLGFWVKPQECEYRAYKGHIYCKASGTSSIGITREIFGRQP